MLKTAKSKKFRIAALSLAILIVLSCIMWKATEANAKEISIDHANITGYNLFGSNKAVSGNVVLAGSEEEPVDMSVFIKSSKNSYTYNNIKWTHNGSGWVSDATMLYEGAGTTQQIAAFYPYQSNVTDGLLIDMSNTLDQSRVTPTDYLYSAYTQMSGRSVALTMKHACTKLIVDPRFGSEVNGDTIAKIEVQNMHRKASMELDGLSLAYPDGATGNTFTYTLYKNTDGNYEALVIPFACTSFPVVITMTSGRVFTTTVSTVNGELAMGTCYTISLQIGQDEVIGANITVDPWIDVDAGDLVTE